MPEEVAAHMEWARTYRRVLDRLPDNQHERRRATVRAMRESVTRARIANQVHIQRRRDRARQG